MAGLARLQLFRMGAVNVTATPIHSYAVQLRSRSGSVPRQDCGGAFGQSAARVSGQRQQRGIDRILRRRSDTERSTSSVPIKHAEDSARVEYPLAFAVGGRGFQGWADSPGGDDGRKALPHGSGGALGRAMRLDTRHGRKQPAPRRRCHHSRPHQSANHYRTRRGHCARTRALPANLPRSRRASSDRGWIMTLPLCDSEQRVSHKAKCNGNRIPRRGNVRSAHGVRNARNHKSDGPRNQKQRGPSHVIRLSGFGVVCHTPKPYPTTSHPARRTEGKPNA